MSNNLERNGMKWSDDDKDFLRTNWGYLSVPGIAKYLKRTTSAISSKALELNLGSAINAGEYITINQLAKAIDVYANKIMNAWIPKRNFPYREIKPVEKKVYKYVLIDEFWKWAKENADLINFSRIEKNILGAEPLWVDERRKIDVNSLITKKGYCTKWTTELDNKLINMLKLYKYTYRDISIALGKTEYAINGRLRRLGISYRPINPNNIPWKESEIEELIKMKNEKHTDTAIASKLGRGQKSVRTKYKTLVDNGLIKDGKFIGEAKPWDEYDEFLKEK